VPTPPQIRIEREVPVPMRDGVVLRAEVWRPDNGAAHPAVLVRTPYFKEGAAPAAVTDPRLATERGYAVVLQDVRGRGSSGGAFDPFVNEEADGADSVAWVAAQPWCDGRVVMAGMSSVGATQWLAAVAAPPALRAIAPTLSSDEFGEGWSLREGVPEHGFLTTWTAGSLVPPALQWLDDAERASEDVDAVAAMAAWMTDWLSEPADSAYWRERSVAGRRDEVQVPALMTGGWYDIFLAATLRAFARSRSPADRLLLGPWGHDPTLSNLVGAANVGSTGLGDPLMWEAALDFYDAVLAGREPAAPRVRAYALGARRWLDLPSWPPPDAGPVTLPLEPGAVAVRPDDPVPALGGRALLIQVPEWGYGIRDQRSLVGRDDVLVALRAPRSKPLRLAGPVRARLAGADGALWTATLCVEHEDGFLQNVCEGVARGGGPDVTVELGDACIEVAPGQALVLLVAGSSYPRWPRPVAAGTQRIGAGSVLELTALP
jgi:uncharacterized protein